MSYFEYAAPLTDRSIDDIIHYARKYDWDLRDDLEGVLEMAKVQHQEVYVNMVWDYTVNLPDTFQTFPGHIFDACWRKADGVRGPFFRISKVYRR